MQKVILNVIRAFDLLLCVYDVQTIDPKRDFFSFQISRFFLSQNDQRENLLASKYVPERSIQPRGVMTIYDDWDTTSPEAQSTGGESKGRSKEKK